MKLLIYIDTSFITHRFAMYNCKFPQGLYHLLGSTTYLANLLYVLIIMILNSAFYQLLSTVHTENADTKCGAF